MDNFERLKGSKPIKTPDFVVPKSRLKQHEGIETKVDIPSSKSTKTGNGILGLFDFKNMAMDSDRSVILMMLALLSGRGEETDEMLIMALLYIML